MTIKKSLVALGTAATVAIAGTGIANAGTDTPAPGGGNEMGKGSTAGSAYLEQNADIFSSMAPTSGVGDKDPAPLGSFDGDGKFDYGKATSALVGLAVGAGAITTIAGAYSAVVKASDTFQGTVDDTVAFLQSQGIL
ncbi:hypothetical protein [Corynebacterium nuruki]|uniref:hypothetical protein n=1 Tax=Corynebacterium nuruki TaxID=1032851 RepID=UPI0039BF204F